MLFLSHTCTPQLRKIHLSRSKEAGAAGEAKDAEIVAAYAQQNAFEEFDEIFNADISEWCLC